jgi:hypothetical protein
MAPFSRRSSRGPLRISRFKRFQQTRRTSPRRTCGWLTLWGNALHTPFTSRNVEPKDDSIWAKIYYLFMYQREEFMEHYYKRSSVESAFSMLKAKFGSSVRSKSEWGQVNEVLCKVLCHNICVVIRATHELGVEPAFGSKRTFGSETPLEPKLFIRGGFWCKAPSHGPCTKNPF